jgi:hypothetical protein
VNTSRSSPCVKRIIAISYFGYVPEPLFTVTVSASDEGESTSESLCYALLSVCLQAHRKLQEKAA